MRVRGCRGCGGQSCATEHQGAAETVESKPAEAARWVDTGVIEAPKTLRHTSSMVQFAGADRAWGTAGGSVSWPGRACESHVQDGTRPCGAGPDASRSNTHPPPPLDGRDSCTPSARALPCEAATHAALDDDCSGVPALLAVTPVSQ